MHLSVILWLASLLTAQAAWLLIFTGHLVPGLIDRGRGEVFTMKDVEHWFLSRGHYKLHTLWTCRTCQALWTALGGVILFALVSRSLEGATPHSFLFNLVLVILMCGTNIIISRCLQKLLL